MQYFNYILPENRIAQRHASFEGRREDSKLLRLSFPSQESSLEHSDSSNSEFLLEDVNFTEALSVFKKGDLLVLNNTKVIHARFFCIDEKVKDAEVLLIEQDTSEGNLWRALARPMKKFKSGMQIRLSERLSALVKGRTEDDRFLLLSLIPFSVNASSEVTTNISIQKLVEEDGSIPIPPYIRQGRSDSLDKEMYQTTFAEKEGSVAAPTAGLHFSEAVLQQIRDIGVEIKFVTLHVGPGSFLPVQDYNKHQVFEEKFFVSKDLWDAIELRKNENKRVIAVGTTVLRALETVGSHPHKEELLSKWNSTNLFIKPGFDFKAVDVLFTNFHQPSSTHLLLVEAFIGREAIEAVYDYALSNEYRFLSYGDTSCLERRKCM